MKSNIEHVVIITIKYLQMNQNLKLDNPVDMPLNKYTNQTTRQCRLAFLTNTKMITLNLS